MKYTANKVFILEKGRYVEIRYDEIGRRAKQDKLYKYKQFLPLHVMLMEIFLTICLQQMISTDRTIG